MMKNWIGAALAGALACSPMTATAQTGSPPAPTPPLSEGTETPQPPSPMSEEAMREMMRAMMQDMMQGGRHHDWDRAGRRDKGPRHEWSRMGPRGGGPDGPGDGPRRAMMHGMGMRLMFAIADADGDGALTVPEIQDFHGRIFKAVDGNDDGRVDMKEIEAFFHGQRPDEGLR